MKKTVALVMILTLVTVFFCASVSAATDGYYNFTTSKNASKTVNNVAVSVVGVQLSYPSNSYTTQQGIYQYYSDLQVVYTVRVINNNSTSMYISGLWIRPSFDESTYEAYTTNIDNFSTDLIGTVDSTNGGIALSPSADWSFLGNICIPANTSLSAVFTVSMRAYKYSTSSTVSSWFVPELSSMFVSNFNAYSTDFTPQGAHDDLLISLEALHNYLTGNTGIPAINATLNNIVSMLTSIDSHIDDIERLLTWVGQYSDIGIGNRSSATNTSINNVKAVVRNFGSVPVTDFEILPPNVVVSDVLYKHPIQIEIETNFSTDKIINGSFVVDNFMATGTSSFDNPIIYSDEINVVGIAAQDGYYDAYIRYEGEVIHKGRQFSSIWLYVYSRSSYLPVNSSFIVSLTTSDYQSDVESQSDSLVNQSNNAHAQEEAFFNQNSQAIANTGLGNYQFDINQRNGITVVTGLFNRLWQSVGSWNTVYIFSLTITVALTILRYTTNAIRRRSYSDDKGGKP